MIRASLKAFLRFAGAQRYTSSGLTWTFSRYANGVRAIDESPTSAPTPLALGLNMKLSLSWPCEVCARCEAKSQAEVTPGAAQAAQHIRRNQAGLGKFFGSSIASQSMHVRSQSSRLKCREPLCQK